MSLANILKTNKSHFTDSISEYDLTSVKCDSIGSRVGLAPLILEGVGISGNGSAIVGAMSAVETAGLFSNDAQKVADLSGGVMDFTNPPLVNGEPLSLDASANIVYTDTIPADLSSNDFFLYQDENKVAKLLKEDPSDLFRQPPPIENYTGTVHPVSTENQLRALLAGASFTGIVAGDIVELRSNLIITTPLEILINVELRGEFRGRKITCTDATTTIDCLADGCLIRQLTIENGNTGSTASSIVIRNTNLGNAEIKDCNIVTNEFGVICQADAFKLYDCSFSFVGTPDSNRYILLSRCVGETYIVNCDFGGNTISSTQGLLMNSGTAGAYDGGKLHIYECRGGTVANPVQRLGICEIDLTGAGFELWLKDNDFLTSSGYFIFYGATALEGVSTIGLLNNIETSVDVDDGKGLIGLDSFAPAGDLPLPILYARGNQPASLRSDYPSYSAVTGLVAYKNTIFSPTQTLELSYDFRFATEGGGFALTDLQMNSQKITFTDGKISILGADNEPIGKGDRSIAIGRNSGITNQGVSAVAVGNNAGFQNQGIEATAVGPFAGLLSQGDFAVSVGRTAGQTFQGEGAVAVGRSAGFQNQGSNSVAIGRSAGVFDQHANSIVLNATGSTLNTANTDALYVKPVRNATTTDALYYDATSGEVSYGAVSGGGGSWVGDATSDLSMNDFSITFNNDKIRLGTDAGATGQADRGIAIGGNAGNLNQGLASIAIGKDTGFENQGQSSIAIGQTAGFSTQGQFAVAIGPDAGQLNQEDSSVAVGLSAGQSSQKIGAIAIGDSAGNSSQQQRAIAIGENAGQTTQGTRAIAIGENAGNSNQSIDGVSIGRNAGQTSQQTSAIAIGIDSGLTSQGQRGVAIGERAGRASQGNRAIAIGQDAGSSNQGVNSVAIGASAGQADQHDNTIVLNGTANTVNTDGTDRLFINPIRGVAHGLGVGVLKYDPTSKEITYSTD